MKTAVAWKTVFECAKTVIYKVLSKKNQEILFSKNIDGCIENTA